MSEESDKVEPRNCSGGGIVRVGAGDVSRTAPATIDELAARLRRRWASGVAVVTATDADAGFRGVTVTSLMAVSQEPPILAIALAASNTFQLLAEVGTSLGVSMLESSHEFPAERFAGRAPVPDARFTGIRHRIENEVPILEEALAWCMGRVASREEIGDHILVLLEIVSGGLGPDTDDPLLSYEGRYRRLETG